MNRTARCATALVATMAAGISLAGVAPAQSETLVPSRVTVTSTDYTPASGETFRLYGAVRSDGGRVPATIRVKTFRDGKWVQLSGAVVNTNRYDRYRIRVVLQMKGERLLRVIGNPDDDSIATVRKTITVDVH